MCCLSDVCLLYCSGCGIKCVPGVPTGAAGPGRELAVSHYRLMRVCAEASHQGFLTENHMANGKEKNVKVMWWVVRPVWGAVLWCSDSPSHLGKVLHREAWATQQIHQTRGHKFCDCADKSSASSVLSLCQCFFALKRI